MKKVITLVLVVLSCVSVQSQNRNCGTMQHLDEIRQNDPKVDMRMESESLVIKKWSKSHSKSAFTVLTIPVVVHVLYKTSSQNISDSQIMSQLNTLNDDFRKQNSDASSIPSAFAGVAADTEIEFCLAVRDPSNNVVNGITRTQTSVSSFSTNDNMKHTSTGGRDAWDTDKYLNIWVCNIGGGILGYAQFPNTGSANEDGVVCNYTAFGNIGTASYPYDLGRTLTHEVGHWLNLRHIWGDSYCGNDYVSDTPNHEEANYGCPTYPHSSSCSGTGSSGEMFMNYMDYTNDACMYMFSVGQKTRMQATLNGSRSSLLTSLGCQAVFVPLTLSSTINDVSCSSINIGTSADGNINLLVTGGTAPFSYSWSNGQTTQDISGLIAGTYIVSVTDAVGQVETASYVVGSPLPIIVNYSVNSSSAPGLSDGSVSVNVSGGTTPYSYYWVGPNSFSATTQDLQNVLAGTYTYYVIDDNGCYELLTIVVPEGTLVPIIVSGSVADIACFGANNGAINLTVNGGATPYSYSWSNGATTQNLSGLSAGIYSVTITGAQSQTYTNTYTISEPSAITATYNVNNVSAIGGNDGSIDLTPSGGVSPYTYYWSTGQNTEDLSNLTAGTYDVWVVDASMCYTNMVVVVSDVVSGCTDPIADNYDAIATVDDGSCITPLYGCTDPSSCNYDSTATVDDGSCYGALGCTDSIAINYDSYACIDDGSCTYPVTCTKPVPTGIYIDEIIQVQAKIHWNDMSSATCMALKYYVNVREVGTTSWSWRVAQDAGLCNQGLPTTSKVMINLTASTDYEYRVKAFYCNTTGSSAWSPMGYFTTADACDNVINLTATPGPQAEKVVFSWDTVSAYSMVRIKLRVDSIVNPTGSDWQMAGGFGVNYPALSVNKWGLTPGETYRGQARTWCDPAGGLYRSPSWTSLIWWTQSASVIRLANPMLGERKVIKITDLLGREVNSNKVIGNATLLYIYNDGTVEKQVIIK